MDPVSPRNRIYILSTVVRLSCTISACYRGDMRLAPLILVFAAGSAGADSRLDREIVSAHNEIRAQVGVPPLVWSDHLEGIARDWAKTLLSRRELSHRPNGALGEKLF